MKNILNFFKKKFLCIDFKSYGIFNPEILMIKDLVSAIQEIEKLKKEDIKVSAYAHYKKTWIAVEKAMENEDLVDLCKIIMNTDSIEEIRGFLFSQIKALYDSKLK